MSAIVNLDFEYLGAHLNDYIQEGNFFDVFEVDDIERIMEYSKLTTNDFVTLLKQSESIINANELYQCTRNANISICNAQDAILILQTVRKYMNLRIFDGIIDILNRMQNETRD